MKIKKYKELILIIFLSFIINFATLNTFPVLDRDEARYAQSTKQMLETNNYSSIKFQDELRSKKPVGIYWLQALSVNILSVKSDSIFSKNQLNDIWKYRIVSSIFSLITSLVMYLVGSKIFDRKTSFFGTLILQCTLLFTIESHIAKTDAVLLTCSVISMLILFGYYKSIFVKKYDITFFVFWSTLGVSILLKGPIIPIMVLIAIIFLIIFEKKAGWLLNTNPLIGIIITILIVLPWFLSLSGVEQNSFFNEGFKKDFLEKILTVQEKHGAFPGSHTIAILFLFFPMSIFLFPTILATVKSIKQKNKFFLIAWIIPNLILLELIPTKLPHYALPLYPAISLLVAQYIVEKNKPIFNSYSILNIFNYLLYLIVFFGICLLLFFAMKNYSTFYENYSYLIIIFVLALISSIIIKLKFHIIKSLYYQVFLSCITSIFIFGFFLPKLDKIWISKNLYNFIKAQNISLNSNYIASIGYNEPSLIFYLGTQTKIIKSLNEDFFEKKLYKYIIIEEKYLTDFKTILERSNYEYFLQSNIGGFNMAKGRWVNTMIYKLKEK